MIGAHTLRRTLVIVAVAATGLIAQTAGPATADTPECRQCTRGHDGLHHGGEGRYSGNGSGTIGSGSSGHDGRGNGGRGGGPGSHR
ncbi:hypothetical protein LTV02_04925 [Nocardia yamanashiensis]|uniref:hypothetical protein n=1 Tax=Nocardia yamanashiensis TaxID=209247 RepID=UPI001E291830|nr:hypothetical protein [Nocardia yamanashiensis]UGT42759.1 hypothetical protein LTV02_04925 [Nocardia yamanashiensis]